MEWQKEKITVNIFIKTNIIIKIKEQKLMDLKGLIMERWENIKINYERTN